MSKEISLPESKEDFKFAPEQVATIQELIRNWKAAKNVIFTEDDKTLRLNMFACLIVALHDAIIDMPGTLVICNECSASEWIRAIRSYSKTLKPVVSSKTEVEEELDKESIRYSKHRNPEFDVFIISKDQFLSDKKTVPELTYSILIMDNFLYDNASTSALRDKIKKTQSCQRMLGTSSTESCKMRELQALIGAIRGRKSDSTAKNVLNGIIEQFKVTIEKVQKEILEKPEKKRKKPGRKGKPAPPKEDLIICPMTDYQQKVYKNCIWNAKDALLTDSLDTEQLIELCSKLFTACNHPIISDGYFVEDKELAEKLNNQSGKLIFLERFLLSKYTENEKVIVICEDDESIDLVDTALKQHQVKFSIIIETTPAKLSQSTLLKFKEEPSILLIEECIVRDILSEVEPSLIITFDSFWQPILSFDIFSSYPTMPRFIRLLTEKSVDEDLFVVNWHNKRFTPERMLQKDTTDPERLMKILKHSALQITTVESVRGTTWWNQYYDKLKTITYNDKSTLDPFDSSKVAGEDFWAKIFPEGVSKIIYAHKKKESFWKPDVLAKFIDGIRNFGLNRWDKIGIDRDQNELKQVADILFLRLERQYKTQKLKFTQEVLFSITPPNSARPIVTLAQIFEAMGSVTAETFFNDFECAATIQVLISTGFDNLNMEHGIPPPAEDWTVEDDKKLIQSAYDIGILNITDDIHDNAVGVLPYLRKIAYSIGDKIKTRRRKDPQRPYVRTKITLNDHKKIIESLLRYGFPNAEDFSDFALINHVPLETITKYVQHVTTYCTTTDEQVRKAESEYLAEKPTKYVFDVIPSRLEWFSKCRELATHYSDICAEDLESFAVIGFHGTSHYSSSITLLSFTQGSVSESKVYKKLKSLITFETSHSGKAPVKYDLDVRTSLPIRLGDQIICEEIGKIDDRPEFHNSFAVYPIGYKVKVVTIDCHKPNQYTFAYSSIEEENNQPVFVITIPGRSGFKLQGPTPQKVWNLYRNECIKHTKNPVFKFYGDEMFGFTSPTYHKIMYNVLEPTECTDYVRRVFRNPVNDLSSKEIRIGVYTPPVSEKPVVVGRPGRPRTTPLPQLNSAVEFPKFHFNFSLISPRPGEVSLTIAAPSVPCVRMLKFYQELDDHEFEESPVVDHPQ